MSRVEYLLTCYAGEKFMELSEDLQCEGEAEKHPEDLNRSSETEKHADWNLFLASDSILPVVEHQENVRNGVLNFRMRQNIRSLARKLQTAADSLNIRPSSALLSVERAILLNEGLNQDEMQVVRSIHLEKAPTTVSRVAEHLGSYMTSHTFRAALRYLSYSAKSPLEELALACELVKVIFPKIRQLSRTDSVYNTINKFIEEKMDEVLH